MNHTLGLKRDYYRSVCSGYLLIALNMLAQVFLIPMYIKHLGAYQYGVFLLIFSFINYAAIGIGFMSGGALRLISENYSTNHFNQLKSAYCISKIVYVIYSLIIGLAFILYVLFIKGMDFFSPLPAEGLRILAVTCLYLIVKYDFSVEIQLLVGVQKQFLANLYQILSQAFYLIFVLLYFNQGGTAVSGVLFFNLISVCAAKLLILKSKRKLLKGQLRYHNDKTDRLSVLKKLFGKMGMGYAIYGFIILTYQSDLLLIGTISNKPELITQYAITWKLAEAGIMLLWKIPETMQPYIIELDARKDYSLLKRQYKKINSLSFLLSLTASLGFIVFGKAFIEIWMGAEYMHISAIQIILTAFVIFFDGIKRPSAIYAYSLVHLKELNILSGSEAIVKCLLIWYLFPKFGILVPLVIRILLSICFVYLYFRLGNRIMSDKPY